MIGANLLFDQAYDRWTLFNTIVGAVIGFLGYFVARGQRAVPLAVRRPGADRGQGCSTTHRLVTQPFDINGWLWGLIGGAALALVMFLLSAPRQQLARLPLAVVGFTGLRRAHRFAFDESARPALDWTKLGICVVVGVVVFGLIGLLRGGARHCPAVGAHRRRRRLAGRRVGRRRRRRRQPHRRRCYATVVPAAILGVRFGLATEPDAPSAGAIEQKSRAWIFLTPALAFIVVGLVVPLIRTIYLSFRNRNSAEFVGWDNYEDDLQQPELVRTSTTGRTSSPASCSHRPRHGRLGVVAGIVSGRTTRQKFERGPGVDRSRSSSASSSSPAPSCRRSGARSSTTSGGSIVVTSLSTAFGLGVAVLADRAKGENIAKSLIFLPMAISFVGAGIIWRFMYLARDRRSEPDRRDERHLGLARRGRALRHGASRSPSSSSAWSRSPWRSSSSGRWRPSGDDAPASPPGSCCSIGYFIYRFLGPGLGGYVEADGGSAADDAVPPGAAVQQHVADGGPDLDPDRVRHGDPVGGDQGRADRADRGGQDRRGDRSQIFWRITMPQIAPTIGVVVTTLIVIVMKVFDIVKVTTNGNFDTQVIANQMFTAAFGNRTTASGRRSPTSCSSPCCRSCTSTSAACSRSGCEQARRSSTPPIADPAGDGRPVRRTASCAASRPGCCG